MVKTVAHSLKLAKGTLRKPRKRPTEALGPREGVGQPPSHLSAQQRSVWRELAKQLPVGSTAASDRIGFETLVRLVTQMRQPDGKFSPPLFGQVRMLLSAYGMTPADRQRIGPPPLWSVPPVPQRHGKSGNVRRLSEEADLDERRAALLR